MHYQWGRRQDSLEVAGSSKQSRERQGDEQQSRQDSQWKGGLMADILGAVAGREAQTAALPQRKRPARMRSQNGGETPGRHVCP